MTVRQAMQVRLEAHDRGPDRGRIARLPSTLKADRNSVRLGMMKRLAASRLFALGDRAGVLRTAQKRSGRAFRLDVRQRVIVKGLVSRHIGQGAVRGEALGKHLAYLGRAEAGAEGQRPEFFERTEDGVDAAQITDGWGADRHHFRFIISPEHGDRIADLRDYTREVMRRVSADLGEPDLAWVGTCHFDTDQPHAHVVVRGRKTNGRDLVIPRDYMGYGFRARAQEVAHERLGNLSRAEAERRIWRETQADRFTGFDRRLEQAADEQRMVDDGVGGTDAWAALTRGRLRKLEALGLATRVAQRYRLHDEMEPRLRGLQLRQDIIRTLHQRRLETGRTVRELGVGRLRGRVVGRGTHDELGGTAWVIVRDRDRVEHYARLAFAQRLPDLGKTIELTGGPRGALVVGAVRSPVLER